MVVAHPPRPRSSGARALGFTAIELMVVVALLAILASLAAPSFRNISESYRADAARDNLLNTIQFARTEAIRTGRPILMQRKTDCPNNDWSCGWVLYQDTNGDNAQQADEPTIRETEVQSNVTITANNNAVNNRLEVNNFGQFGPGVFFSFIIAPMSESSTRRCISMTFSAGMRATLDKSADICP